MPDAIETLIADLQSHTYSARDQVVICLIANFIAALNEIEDNVGPIGTVQNANTVFSGPASGAAALPTFRALVSADIPGTLNSFDMTAGDTITPDQEAGIIGTTTNNNANAGSVGEFIDETIAIGAALGLSTATPKQIASIALTPGDWEVNANVSFTGGNTTVVTELDGGISTTVALPTTGLTSRGQTSYGAAGIIPFAINNISLNIGPTRISIAADTNVLLIANALFTTSTCSAYGEISARRVR